jgi:hypothetical protein
MQIVLPKDYQPDYEVKIDNNMIVKAENMYNRIENTLKERFSEAAQAFGFDIEDEINFWDFLSINSTPRKLKQLQKFITNFKSEKVKITLQKNKENKNNLDWLNELKVEEFKQEECQQENTIPSATSTTTIDKDYFVLDI